MNIVVIKDASKHIARTTGGGSAATTVEVTIDPDMTEREQILTLFQEVVEAYLPCLSDTKIEEITELFDKGLDGLSGII